MHCKFDSYRQETETAEPIVLLELPLENGTSKVIELSVKQFHLLRLQTAVALSKVINVREKLGRKYHFKILSIHMYYSSWYFCVLIRIKAHVIHIIQFSRVFNIFSMKY